jgi:putative hydrolase of HD superfamily
MSKRVNVSQFILNRRLAQVKRYHATPMFQNETVAEHGFYVALIGRAICGILEEQGIRINTQKVLEKALIHDIEEMFSGDIIQPFKYSDPSLKKLIDQLNTKSVDKAFEGLPKKLVKHFKNLWNDYKDEKSFEDEVVKIADRLSIIALCLEQIKLGNKFMVEVLKNGLRLLSQYKFSWLRPILADIKKEITKLDIEVS